MTKNEKELREALEGVIEAYAALAYAELSEQARQQRMEAALLQGRVVLERTRET